LGPLLFSLVVHPLLTSLLSNLALGYLYDFTLGGPLNTVAADVTHIGSKGASLGLSLKSKKSEVISRSGGISHFQFTGFHQLTPDTATLLGVPLFGQAMDDTSSCLFEDLKLAVDKLQLISAQDALVLLKTDLFGMSQTAVCSARHRAAIILFFVSSMICCTWLLKSLAM